MWSRWLEPRTVINAPAPPGRSVASGVTTRSIHRPLKQQLHVVVMIARMCASCFQKTCYWSSPAGGCWAWQCSLVASGTQIAGTPHVPLHVRPQERQALHLSGVFDGRDTILQSFPLHNPAKCAISCFTASAAAPVGCAANAAAALSCRSLSLPSICALEGLRGCRPR